MQMQANSVHFESFKADRVIDQSSQANVLFGLESNLQQSVVCKQYSVFKLKAMLKEIRVLSALESQRNLEQGSSL